MGDDLERELRVHLEIEAEEQRERGLSEDAARYVALRAFGSPARVKEDVRALSRWAFLDSIARDLHYAVRMLRKHRAFTLTVVITLAVGVGASTALFTILRNVVLRPLGFPDSDRVLLVYNSYPKAGIEHAGAAAADYDDRRRGVTIFEEQSLFTTRTPGLDVGGSAERILAMYATASLFRLVRTPPAEGRAIEVEEETPGRNRVVVLSAALRRRLFGTDVAVGRDVRIDGVPHVVVGVMPETFAFIDASVDVWLPLTLTQRDYAQLHANNWTYVARLKPGATVSQAQSQVDAVAADSFVRHPELREPLTNAGFHVVAVRLQDDLVREMRPTLRLLWGGALFVLLMGCVNVASLVLARSRARLGEIATRVALGAGRWRVLRQLVTEHLLVSFAAGAAGLALAAGALRTFGGMRVEHLPPRFEIHMDGVVLTYALVSTVLIGVALGVVPVVGRAIADPIAALRDDARTMTAGSGRPLRRALVIAQIAVAFLLMTGAGLLFASFQRVVNVDPGLRTAGVLTGSIELPASRYPDAEALRQVSRDAVTSVRAIPGVVAAGATSAVPFGNNFATRLIMAVGYRPRPGEAFVGPYRNVVTPGYFEAIGARLQSGRFFSDADSFDARPVVIIDTRLARRFWPDRDAVGQELYVPQDRNDLLRITHDTPRFAIIGVIDEIKLRGLVEGVGDVGAYYFVQAQQPERRLTIAVRAATDPAALGGTIRDAIRRVDRELPVADMQTMERRAEGSLSSRRTATTLAVAFGAAALLLSALGIYGVLAYLVAERTREIGIRMALGSSPIAIVELVLREGLRLVACGFVLGAVGAPLLSRGLRSYLFGVTGLDATVLSLVIATVVLAALGACVLPAVRAARIDPVAALADAR